jgi:DNA end-binding protein Ku
VPSKREVEMAGSLVESLHGDFDPKAFKDTYRERVLDLIARKAKGEQLDLPEPEEREETGDLMAALEASLKGRSKSGSKSKSQSGSTARRAPTGCSPR